MIKIKFADKIDVREVTFTSSECNFDNAAYASLKCPAIKHLECSPECWAVVRKNTDSVNVSVDNIEKPCIEKICGTCKYKAR